MARVAASSLNLFHLSVVQTATRERYRKNSITALICLGSIKLRVSKVHKRSEMCDHSQTHFRDSEYVVRVECVRNLSYRKSSVRGRWAAGSKNPAAITSGSSITGNAQEAFSSPASLSRQRALESYQLIQVHSSKRSNRRIQVQLEP